ncbi:hypothetical protein [Streptomyces fractus]|uniref:hypothetical protein n=1 Tax=Streptomyces fractus TaxID=641806 RepID=UPI003CF648A5
MHSYSLELERQQLINAFLAEQKRQRDEFDGRLADLDARIAQAQQEERREVSDPKVLVRSSLGARRTVYHRAADPCSRTTHTREGAEGFRPMPELEAKLLDGGVLKRCRTCWNY